jgi:hypothetical protein
VQISQLANTCNRIRHICKNGAFKVTEQESIMGFLGRRAQKFRKNGRMTGEDVEDFWRSYKKKKA